VTLLNHAVDTANALQPHVHALAAGGVPNPGSGQAPPGSAKFITIIKWLAWIIFSVCVAGLLAGAGTMAIHHRRHGGGGEAAQGLVMPMIAAVVAASASGIIGVLAT
jgi:hypothetical protein